MIDLTFITGAIFYGELSLLRSDGLLVCVDFERGYVASCVFVISAC